MNWWDQAVPPGAMPTATANGITAAGTAWKRYVYRPWQKPDKAAVYVPSGWVTNDPCVLYFHGYGSDSAQISGSDTTAVREMLLDDGYMIASSTAGSTLWGNDTEKAAHLDLMADITRLWTPGPILLLSRSAGGIAGLTILAQDAIPNIKGWCGRAAVCNLDAVYVRNHNGHGTAIDAAYPNAAMRNLHDPGKMAVSDFAGKRLLLCASPDDTIVLKTDNADFLTTRISGVTAVCDEVVTSGEHDAVSQWDPAAIHSFYAACLAA